MAIHPIDLQTMYAQLQNVAKQAAFQQEGVQLAESMKQAEMIRENEEKSKRVNETEENAKASTVKQDGRNDADASGGKKSGGAHDEDEQQRDSGRIKESYLGQHIDVMR